MLETSEYSEAPLSKLEKFEHSLALPNIKYNSILFSDKCIGYLLMLPHIFSQSASDWEGFLVQRKKQGKKMNAGWDLQKVKF